MQRLTFDGNFCDISRCADVCEGMICEDDACSQRKTWERLKAIEDILGNDYDLDRLRELAWADREGRCVVLPFKVGGTVYTNIAIQGDRYKKSDRPYPAKVAFVGIGDGSIYFNVEYENGRLFPVELGEIGKTVFLTREAAEKALEEMEGNENG